LLSSVVAARPVAHYSTVHSGSLSSSISSSASQLFTSALLVLLLLSLLLLPPDCTMPSETPGYELSIYSSRENRQRNPSSSQLQPDPSDLLSLPLELHYLIFAHLDLDGLLALRRTCRIYTRIITIDLVRQLFIQNGRASACLTACCNQCLCTPGLDRLVIDSALDSDAWRSVCFRCWGNRITQDYHLNPWPHITLANGGEGYVCHFCNWPVVNTGQNGDPGRLHAACRARRRLVIVIWFMMAFLQFGLGVICAVLAWTRYRSRVAIVVPSSVRLSPPGCLDQPLTLKCSSRLILFWQCYPLLFLAFASAPTTNRNMPDCSSPSCS